MSLLVWLPLNGSIENQGLAGDIKIIGGTATIADNGKIGKCYSFIKTSNQYLMGAPAPLNNDMNEWSYACWFKPTDVHNGCLLSNRTATNTTGIALFYYNNNQFLFDDGTRWQFTPTIRITPGVWNHIVCVRKKGVGKYLYVNGVLSNSTTATGTPAIATSPYFSIGNSQNGNTSTSVSGNPLNGLLNDVRIYDHALSKKEIEELSKGLIVHYKLDNPYNDNFVNLLADQTIAFSRLTGATISATKVNGKYILTTGNSSTSNSGRMTVPLSILTNNTKYILQFKWNQTAGSAVQLNPTDWCNMSLSNVIKKVCSGYNYFEAKCSPRANGEYNSTYRFLDFTEGANATYELWDFQLEEYAENSITHPYSNNKNNSALTEIFDSSGYLNHGKLVGTLNTQINSSNYDYCAHALGASGHIEGIKLPVSDYLSVSFWLKPDNLSHGFLSFADNINDLCLGYSSSSQHICISLSSNTCYKPLTFTLNKWTHFVIVKNGSTKSVYIDGVLSTAKGSNNWLHAADKFWLFTRSNNNNYPYEGCMSDFRIYTTVLTENQIKELYNTSVSVDNKGNIYPRELVEK